MRVITLVLILLSTRVALASELTGILLQLRARGERGAYILDSSDPDLGWPGAQAFFNRHPPAPGCRAAFELLRDPATREQVTAIQSVTGRDLLHVVLVLTDDRARIYRGETIRVPFAGRSVAIAALADRPLEPLALRLNSTLDVLTSRSPERFAVFPHVLRDEGPRGACVYLGESGLITACRGDVRVIKSVLLHELAHCVEPAAIAQDGEADGGPWQPLSRTQALSEGWADYWALQADPPADRAGSRHFIGPVRALVNQGPPPDVRALGVDAVLACSPVVAGIFDDIARLRPGRAALHAAVRAAWLRPGPGLADVLSEYRRAHPAFAGRLSVILYKRTGSL